jgi:hypothetical protein
LKNVERSLNVPEPFGFVFTGPLPTSSKPPSRTERSSSVPHLTI